MKTTQHLIKLSLNFYANQITLTKLTKLKIKLKLSLMKLFNTINKAWNSLKLNWLVDLEDAVMYFVLLNFWFKWTLEYHAIVSVSISILCIYIILCATYNQYLKSIK